MADQTSIRAEATLVARRHVIYVSGYDPQGAEGYYRLFARSWKRFLTIWPLATKLGVHPVHLGVRMIVNTEVGLCHPPVGLNLYIASSIAKMGISEITMAVLPWLGAMLIFLIMITYIPEISLWLPRTLGVIH